MNQIKPNKPQKMQLKIKMTIQKLKIIINKLKNSLNKNILTMIEKNFKQLYYSLLTQNILKPILTKISLMEKNLKLFLKNLFAPLLIKIKNVFFGSKLVVKESANLKVSPEKPEEIVMYTESLTYTEFLDQEDPNEIVLSETYTLNTLLKTNADPEAIIKYIYLNLYPLIEQSEKLPQKLYTELKANYKQYYKKMLESPEAWLQTIFYTDSSYKFSFKKLYKGVSCRLVFFSDPEPFGWFALNCWYGDPTNWLISYYLKPETADEWFIRECEFIVVDELRESAITENVYTYGYQYILYKEMPGLSKLNEEQRREVEDNFLEEEINGKYDLRDTFEYKNLNKTNIEESIKQYKSNASKPVPDIYQKEDSFSEDIGYNPELGKIWNKICNLESKEELRTQALIEILKKTQKK